MDSLINTGAMSLTVDVYKNYINPTASNTKTVTIGRASTLIISILSLLIALRIQSVLTISWIASDFLTCGAFIPLVFGFLWARGSSRAATISMLFGLLFSTYNLLIAMGVDLPVAWEIASAKQAIVGIVISFALYIGLSLVSNEDTKRNRDFINKAGLIKL